MVTEAPDFDAGSGLPRLPNREAIDASRGYVAGWTQAIDAILRGGEDDVVYVEAFEDAVVVAASGEIGGVQIKDKAGKFAVTQEEPCGMLGRWASVVERRPVSGSASAAAEGGKPARSKHFIRGAGQPTTALRPS